MIKPKPIHTFNRHGVVSKRMIVNGNIYTLIQIQLKLEGYIDNERQFKTGVADSKKVVSDNPLSPGHVTWRMCVAKFCHYKKRIAVSQLLFIPFR